MILLLLYVSVCVFVCVYCVPVGLIVSQSASCFPSKQGLASSSLADFHVCPRWCL